MMKIESGKVVQVQTVNGVSLGIFKWRFSKHPQTGQQGNWYCVNVEGVDCLAVQSSILDEDPACDGCGWKKFWWTASFHVRCERCIPPFPDWSSMWRDFTELVGRLSDKFGENAEGIAELVAIADRAFVGGDWCEFLRVYTIAGTIAEFDRQIGGYDEQGTL